MKIRTQYIVLLFVCTFVFSGCSIDKKTYSEESVPAQSNPASTVSTSSSSPILTQADFTARFEIYTNGTRRIFTDPKYHRQSPDMYIENPDPHLIYVKKSGLTWNDFFKTLPFSLQKDCLITGTKQTFCNTETKKLHFYINDQEVPDALDRLIQPNDMLRVEYT